MSFGLSFPSKCDHWVFLSLPTTDRCIVFLSIVWCGNSRWRLSPVLSLLHNSLSSTYGIVLPFKKLLDLLLPNSLRRSFHISLIRNNLNECNECTEQTTTSTTVFNVYEAILSNAPPWGRNILYKGLWLYYVTHRRLRADYKLLAPSTTRHNYAELCVGDSATRPETYVKAKVDMRVSPYARGCIWNNHELSIVLKIKKIKKIKRHKHTKYATYEHCHHAYNTFDWHHCSIVFVTLFCPGCTIRRILPALLARLLIVCKCTTKRVERREVT